MNELYSQWLGAIRAITATEEGASRFLDRRLRFTTEVARALFHEDPSLDPLAYGVWLENHESPVYIDQTVEGRRRLWDLPIGESHHLANSLPPEVWGRVVVIYWGLLLDRDPVLVSESTGAVQPLLQGKQVTERQAIGLGVEYLLQREWRPLFNRRKKRRDGGWRPVDWNRRQSSDTSEPPT